MTEPIPVNVAPLCQPCITKLVRGAHYREQDPWQALSIVAQIALFQASTADPKTYERIDSDPARFAELGCLGCYKPRELEIIIEVAKTRDLGAIKRLGEKWVLEAAKTTRVN